jgi:hypothetical protein
MAWVANSLVGDRAQRDSWSLHLDGMAVCRVVAAMALDDHRPLHGQPGCQLRKARPDLGESPALEPRARGRALLNLSHRYPVRSQTREEDRRVQVVGVRDNDADQPPTLVLRMHSPEPNRRHTLFGGDTRRRLVCEDALPKTVEAKRQRSALRLSGACDVSWLCTSSPAPPGMNHVGHLILGGHPITVPTTSASALGALGSKECASAAVDSLGAPLSLRATAGSPPSAPPRPWRQPARRPLTP